MRAQFFPGGRAAPIAIETGGTDDEWDELMSGNSVLVPLTSDTGFVVRRNCGRDQNLWATAIVGHVAARPALVYGPACFVGLGDDGQPCDLPASAWESSVVLAELVAKLPRMPVDRHTA